LRHHRPGAHQSRRSSWWWVVSAATGLAVIAVAVVLRVGWVMRFDASVSASARAAALAHPAWRHVMYAVTWTANTTTLTPVAATAALLLLWRCRWRQACLVATAMIGTSAARLLLLNTIDRPRPSGQLAPSAGWAFPSGHTTGAATAAMLAVVIVRPLLRAAWSRNLLVALAGGWALAVGVSRVALVVHWPTDVVAAWLLVAVLVPSITAALTRLLGTVSPPR
jgi:undecaprenyl-diphosphatase